MEPVPPAGPSRPPSIRDVARRAGVGIGTVSRVLNEHPRVSEATNARVRAAITELGYRRSRNARALALGLAEPRAIGVVAPFITAPSVAERIRGVAERLTARGYDLVLFDVETPAQQTDAFTSFARRHRVDGLLAISLAPTAEEAARLRADGQRVVLVDVDGHGFPHVAIDDAVGGRLAAEHLLARGHRRLAFVGDAPDGRFGFRSSERRRTGFRAALAEAGVGEADVQEALGPHGRAEACAMTAGLLAGPAPPTAVFAASDIQAIGVLEAARAAGARVPEDVAVIGFDDLEVASVLGLTTVRQPLGQTGAVGADLLVSLVEGTPAARPVLEPLRVVERATT